MGNRLAILAVSLLVLGFALAACGGDDDTGSDTGSETGSGQSTSTGESSSGGETSSPEATDEGTGDDAPTPGLGPDAAKRAGERCLSALEGQTQLSNDIAADLEELCRKAAAGDQDAVRNAAREVCVKIVEKRTPAGPARDDALKACDRSGATP